jgi:hypothetical protein
MTLLISVENGFSSRYLLRTGILGHLLDAHVPVLVVSPNAEEEYFREFLRADGVEVLSQPPIPNMSKRSLRRTLELIRHYGLPAADERSNIDVRYQAFLERRPMRPVFLKTFALLVRAHRRHRWVRGTLTRIGRGWDVQAYRKILIQRRVSLLLLDGLGFVGPRMSEWARAAQGQCRSLTVVTNWDHPTAKGYRSECTDHYLVWSPAMQNELMIYHDVPPERIEQTGSALFDVYATPGALLDREQVCGQLGLDPQRPIVLYVSNSPVNFPHNFAIASWLVEHVRMLPHSPQLIVRLHPLFLRASAEAELERHRELSKHPGVAYSIPRVLSQTLVPDMDADEICISASLIRVSDVVVNLFSTMQLDACICDKPVINIAFDWAHGAYGSQRASQMQYYDHLRRISAAGAVRLASSRAELHAQIRQALADPCAQSQQRRQIVAQEAGVVDGHAAQRIANAILRQYDIAARV